MSGATAVAARTLCWRSDLQLAGLRTGLNDVLDAWARAWALPAASVQVRNAWQAPTAREGTWRPAATLAGGEVVAWIHHAQDIEAALARLMFGGAPNQAAAAAPSFGAAGISLALANDALKALHQGVTDWLGQGSRVVSAAGDPPAEDLRAWSGAVRATVEFGPQAGCGSLCLHVRASAWAAPRPTRGVAGHGLPALSPLSDALADQPVFLQARLTDVHTTVGELVGLRAGDVLVTSHRLVEPLCLSSRDRAGDAVFTGRLTQRQGRMALTLTHSA